MTIIANGINTFTVDTTLPILATLAIAAEFTFVIAAGFALRSLAAGLIVVTGFPVSVVAAVFLIRVIACYAVAAVLARGATVAPATGFIVVTGLSVSVVATLFLVLIKTRLAVTTAYTITADCPRPAAIVCLGIITCPIAAGIGAAGTIAACLLGSAIPHAIRISAAVTWRTRGRRTRLDGHTK